FGMLRYTDTAWMDDRTAPSVHVRHNLEGLASAFPLAYLLSFVTDHDSEPLHDSPDLPLYFRSRMEGALGLCFLTGDLSEADVSQISREISTYKAIQDTLRGAAGTLLTTQAADSNGPPWDVLQATAADGESVVIYAYQSDDSLLSINVQPTALQSSAMY